MGQFKFLDVGCGDATLIKTSQHTFLIDCNNIGDFRSELPASKRLRGVFITHQHSDHYSGLVFLRDHKYDIDFLIYSPYERRSGDSSVTIDEWNEFNSLKDYFVGRGTKAYPEYRQDSLEKAYWETGEVNFWIIGPAKSVAASETRELHDACLVIMAKTGNRAAIMTGDASDKNLNYIAKNTTKYCNDILRASHHGSINGADLDFIKGCNANYTVISTRSGVHENVPHPTALKRYNDHTKVKVYRTDQSGTVTFEF